MMNTTMKLHDFFLVHGTLNPSEIILDVRNPDEFAQAHIAGALNIPLPELPQRQTELSSFQRVFIHCKRGGRAKTAFGVLEAAGFKNLVCIDDAGMDSWIEAGYPVAR
jgi:rhodanese-related sulfurtransferase